MASGGLSCGENRPQLPHSLTIYSKSSISAPKQWQKQTKSSSSPLFVSISFPQRKRTLLKYSATSKWHVTLTRLFSLMSSSPNPSMIHLPPTPSLRWGTLQNSYWLKREKGRGGPNKKILGAGFQTSSCTSGVKMEPCDTMGKWISAQSTYTHNMLLGHNPPPKP